MYVCMRLMVYGMSHFEKVSVVGHVSQTMCMCVCICMYMCVPLSAYTWCAALRVSTIEILVNSFKNNKDYSITIAIIIQVTNSH